VGGGAGLHLRGRPTNVLQCLFAQDIGIVLTRFCKFDDLVGDGLFDPVVAVSNPQSDADHFEGNAEDALILWVKPFAVEVWANWHGALPCDRRERYRTLSHRTPGRMLLSVILQLYSQFVLLSVRYRTDERTYRVNSARKLLPS
jgi:hypothetical protein